MSDLGSFGRRIAERRASLGLTRERLAEQAGVDEGYVRCLEEQSDPSARETADRLARALGTTVAELLDEAPVGAGEAAPGADLAELDEKECLRLIAPGGIGRIAFEGRYGLTVLPVNYRLSDGGAIVFRTTPGGATDADLRTGMRGVEYKVAFEVDRVHELTGGGWSVLVQGSLHHVTDEEEADAAATGVEPWAGGDRRQYLQIRPSRVTGRRIVTG
ncbi:helix-turn-helix domain-containing protein [Nonomuraea rhodomycinica]|uniref:Pyridoxamine 5'-phosphate oxidase family protein n=1 Tax=Nonomuraea rhodomycinica TaxID=1712872 RepID=A0A7Y6MDT7_9ACTN|nr:pyridoxamine 5'-phosphate oxidase family protein [Nonomuraea rhodomycinica]NUW44237.1 pyridoxamine 5'-phosphate oxidase family protein [Nonomuraea rhodomycinica]